MYYLYGKINRGHGICPLYGGCPLLRESRYNLEVSLYSCMCNAVIPICDAHALY